MPRRRTIESVLRVEPLLHPRLFSLILGALWPLLRESDGFVGCRYGPLELRLDLRDSAERQGYMKRYDPSLQRFVETICRPGDVVVDIGANAGFVSAHAACRVGAEGRVLAIEPNPRLASRLRETARRNPLRNLVVVEAAVGDREELRSFYVSSSHPYSTLDPRYLPDYPVDQVVPVQVTTLSRLFEEALEGRPPRLVKIDAQGYENRILAAATDALKARPPDWIVMEAVREDLPETVRLLAELGYSAFRLAGDEGVLEPRAEPDYVEEGDALVFGREPLPPLRTRPGAECRP